MRPRIEIGYPRGRRAMLAALTILATIVSACGDAPRPSSSAASGPSVSTARPSAAAASNAGATPRPGSGNPTGSTPPPSSAPAGSWDAATAGIRRDGTVPLATALSAFEYVYGGMPGVEPPAGPREVVPSGSAAVRMILLHWASLTPEQQARVRNVLDPHRVASTAPLPAPASGGLVAFAGPGPGPVAPAQPPAATIDEYRAIAKTMEERIAELLIRPLSVPIEVIFHDLPLDPKDPGALSYAATVPIDNFGEMATYDSLLMTKCQIQLSPAGLSQLVTPDDMDGLVAHEVFHCFQFDLFSTTGSTADPTRRRFGDGLKVPMWLGEGSAAWVGEDLAINPTTLNVRNWNGWLTTPDVGLFGRTYSAIGFFMHIQDNGVDPWAIVDAMLRKGAGYSLGAYQVVTALQSGDKIVDGWGPSFFRDGGAGQDFAMAGKALPQETASPTVTKQIGDAGVEAIEVKPLTALAVNANVSSDVFVIRGRTGRGLVRFADKSQKTVAEALGVPFCMKAGGCSCKSGTNGAALKFVNVPRGAIQIGFSGDRDGVEASLQGYTPDTICDKKPTDLRPPEPCYCPPGPLGLGPVPRVLANLPIGRTSYPLPPVARPNGT